MPPSSSGTAAIRLRYSGNVVSDKAGDLLRGEGRNKRLPVSWLWRVVGIREDIEKLHVGHAFFARVPLKLFIGIS